MRRFSFCCSIELAHRDANMPRQDNPARDVIYMRARFCRDVYGFILIGCGLGGERSTGAARREGSLDAPEHPATISLAGWRAHHLACPGPQGGPHGRSRVRGRTLAAQPQPHPY
jgi:hypothetical protein